MASQDFLRALRERGFSIKDKVGILYHNSDPTILPGYDAPPGSILLVQLTSLIGDGYVKVGLANTDWISITSSQASFQTYSLTIPANSTQIVTTLPDTIKSIKYSLTIEDIAGNITTSSINIVNSAALGLDFTEYGIIGDIFSYNINVTTVIGTINVGIINTNNTDYIVTLTELKRV